MIAETILNNALQALFDNMHAFIFLKDTENRLVKVNRRVADSHGLKPEDMAGRHSREFYGEQADLYFEDDKEVIRSGVPKLNIIEPLPLGEGNIRWIETSKIPVSGESGKVVGILVIASDITEKRKAERELAESQATLHAIVENLRESLAFYSPDERLAFANPTFWRLHEQAGLGDLVEIGKSFEDISRDILARMAERGDIDDPDTLRDDLLKAHRSAASDYQIKLGERWIHVRRYATPDGGRVVFGYDVTEYRAAKSELEESRNLLHTIVEHFQEGLALYGPDTRLQYGNLAYWKLVEDAGAKDFVKIGTTFREEIEGLTTGALEVADKGRFETSTERLLDHYEHYDEGLEMQFGEKWIRIHRYATPDNGRIVLGYDITENKRSERKLEDSQRLLESIVENLSEPLALYGPDHRLEFANRAFWRAHDGFGTCDVVKVGAHYKEIIRAVCQRAAESGDIDDIEAAVARLVDHYDNPQGGLQFKVRGRWFSLQRYVMPNGGRLQLAYDITDPKKAEQELKASQDLLQTVVDSFKGTLSLYGPDTRLQYGNPAFWDLMQEAGLEGAVRTGATYEEIASNAAPRLAKLNQSGDPDGLAKQLIENDRRQSADYELQFGDRIMRTHRYPTPDGGRVVFGYDVTESLKAERALRESEKRYQTLAKTAPVGIFRTDSDGFCSYQNDVWHSITSDFHRKDAGVHWADVFDTGVRDFVRDHWRAAAVEHGFFHFEGRISGPADEETWVLATIGVEDSRAAGPSSFVGTLTDITRLKQVETRLRSTERELRDHRDALEELVERRTAALKDAQQSLLMKERLAAIGQLTATVSHELRNPLGTISTSFAAMKRRVDFSDDKLSRSAERIERNIQRCETIIADLLNYTRIERLNREPLQIDTWLTQVLGEAELPPDAVVKTNLKANSKATIDRDRMRQVLANLVGNALDAMREATEKTKVIEVESARDGDRVVIWVRDQGSGLKPDIIDQVFEPLVSTKTFGVGLGLPFVRQIVELHGGQVTIRNRNGLGAEVEVRIPTGLHVGGLDNGQPLQNSETSR